MGHSIKIGLDFESLHVDNIVSGLAKANTLANKMQLPKNLTKQINDLTDSVNTMAATTKTLDKTKVDASKFKEITEQFKKLDERISFIEQTLAELGKGGDVSNLSKAFGEVHQSVTNTTKAIQGMGTALQQATNPQKNKTNKKELEDQLRILKELRKLTGQASSKKLSLITNTDIKDADSEALKRMLIEQLNAANQAKTALKQAMDPKNWDATGVKQYTKEFYQAYLNIDKLSEKLISLNGDEALSKITFKGGKNAEGVIEGIEDYFSILRKTLTSQMESISKQLENFSQGTQEELNSFSEDFETGNTKYSKSKTQLTIPLHLPKDQYKKLKAEIDEIVDQIQDQVKPLEVRVALVSGYKTRKNEELMSQLTESLDGIKNKKIRDKVSGLIDTLQESFNRQLHIDFEVEGANRAKEVVKNVVEDLQALTSSKESKVFLNVDAKLSDESLKTVTEQLENIDWKPIKIDIKKTAKGKDAKDGKALTKEYTPLALIEQAIKRISTEIEKKTKLFNEEVAAVKIGATEETNALTPLLQIFENIKSVLSDISSLSGTIGDIKFTIDGSNLGQLVSAAGIVSSVVSGNGIPAGVPLINNLPLQQQQQPQQQQQQENIKESQKQLEVQNEINDELETEQENHEDITISLQNESKQVQSLYKQLSYLRDVASEIFYLTEEFGKDYMDTQLNQEEFDRAQEELSDKYKILGSLSSNDIVTMDDHVLLNLTKKLLENSQAQEESFKNTAKYFQNILTTAEKLERPIESQAIFAERQEKALEKANKRNKLAVTSIDGEEKKLPITDRSYKSLWQIANIRDTERDDDSKSFKLKQANKEVANNILKMISEFIKSGEKSYLESIQKEVEGSTLPSALKQSIRRSINDIQKVASQKVNEVTEEIKTTEVPKKMKTVTMNKGQYKEWFRENSIFSDKKSFNYNFDKQWESLVKEGKAKRKGKNKWTIDVQVEDTGAEEVKKHLNEIQEAEQEIVSTQIDQNTIIKTSPEDKLERQQRAAKSLTAEYDKQKQLEKESTEILEDNFQKIKNGIAQFGNFNLSKKTDKQGLENWVKEFRVYQQKGGERSISELTDNQKALEKINAEYQRQDEIKSGLVKKEKEFLALTGKMQKNNTGKVFADQSKEKDDLIQKEQNQVELANKRFEEENKVNQVLLNQKQRFDDIASAANEKEIFPQGDILGKYKRQYYDFQANVKKDYLNGKIEEFDIVKKLKDEYKRLVDLSKEEIRLAKENDKKLKIDKSADTKKNVELKEQELDTTKKQIKAEKELDDVKKASQKESKKTTDQVAQKNKNLAKTEEWSAAKLEAGFQILKRNIAKHGEFNLTKKDDKQELTKQVGQYIKYQELGGPRSINDLTDNKKLQEKITKEYEKQTGIKGELVTQEKKHAEATEKTEKAEKNKTSAMNKQSEKDAAKNIKDVENASQEASKEYVKGMEASGDAADDFIDKLLEQTDDIEGLINLVKELKKISTDENETDLGLDKNGKIERLTTNQKHTAGGVAVLPEDTIAEAHNHPSGFLKLSLPRYNEEKKENRGGDFEVYYNIFNGTEGQHGISMIGSAKKMKVYNTKEALTQLGKDMNFNKEGLVDEMSAHYHDALKESFLDLMQQKGFFKNFVSSALEHLKLNGISDDLIKEFEKEASNFDYEYVAKNLQIEEHNPSSKDIREGLSAQLWGIFQKYLEEKTAKTFKDIDPFSLSDSTDPLKYLSKFGNNTVLSLANDKVFAKYQPGFSMENYAKEYTYEQIIEELEKRLKNRQNKKPSKKSNKKPPTDKNDFSGSLDDILQNGIESAEESVSKYNQVGKDIIDAILSGLKEKAPKFYSYVKALVEGSVDEANKAINNFNGDNKGEISNTGKSKGKIATGASKAGKNQTEEDSAKANYKAKGRNAQKAERDSEYIGHMLENEVEARKRLIESTDAVITSFTEFKDSNDELVKEQIKSKEIIDGAIKETTTTINYDTESGEPFSSDIDTYNYEKYNKMVEAAEKTQAKLKNRIDETQSSLRLYKKSLNNAGINEFDSQIDNIAAKMSKVTTLEGFDELVTDLKVLKDSVTDYGEQLDFIRAVEEKRVESERRVAAEEEKFAQIQEKDIERERQRNWLKNESLKDQEKQFELQRKTKELELNKLSQKYDSYDEPTKKRLLDLYDKLDKVDVSDGWGEYNELVKQFKLQINEAEEDVKSFGETWDDNLKKINAAQGKELDKELGGSKLKEFIEEANGVNKKDLFSDMHKGDTWIGLLSEGVDEAEEIWSNAVKKIGKNFNDLVKNIDNANVSEDLKNQWRGFIGELAEVRAELGEDFDFDIDITQAVSKLDDLENRIKQSLSTDNKKNEKLTDEYRISKLNNKIQEFASKNTNLGPELSARLDQVQQRIDALFKSGASGTALERELKSIDEELNNISSDAKKAGQDGKSFGHMMLDSLKSANARFIANYFSFQDMIRYIRTAFESIRSLDTALVDLKKTTTMSNSDLEQFYLNSSKIAKQTGVTTEEIITQAAAWSRLGFNTKETSETMAELSSQFAKISPGTSVEDATDYLVSTMKAFHVDVADVESEIMDAVNRIGNTMATSNSEVGEMLKRSSAAMSEANNTLAETIALESAAVQITRNAETTGTAFRTISMRIRGLDEETEEALEDYEELKGKIADLTKTAKTPGGISLFTDETKSTYKSTYQLLKEIAAIYHDLTDKQQAGLLEALAGKRGGQVLAGILNDFSEVERAMGEIEQSAGSADAEMKIIEESMDFKINALKETWTQIYQGLIDRGTIGDLIDSLTKLSEVLGWLINNKAALVGVFSVITGGLAAKNNVGGVNVPLPSYIRFVNMYHNNTERKAGD